MEESHSFSKAWMQHNMDQELFFGYLSDQSQMPKVQRVHKTGEKSTNGMRWKLTHTCPSWKLNPHNLDLLPWLHICRHDNLTLHQTRKEHFLNTPFGLQNHLKEPDVVHRVFVCVLLCWAGPLDSSHHAQLRLCWWLSACPPASVWSLRWATAAPCTLGHAEGLLRKQRMSFLDG